MRSLPVSINFGHRLFSDPTAAAQWVPPSGPGVYAILIADRLCHPRPFRPIYFGQTGDFAERGFFKGHGKYWEWRAVADAEANLFVATYPMPFSTLAAREGAERDLVQHYRPVCNEPQVRGRVALAAGAR